MLEVVEDLPERLVVAAGGHHQRGPLRPLRAKDQPRARHQDGQCRGPAPRGPAHDPGVAPSPLASTDTDKRRGEWFEPEADRITVDQWHNRWWATIENSDRAANTVVQYESILRLYVLPHLGTRTKVSLRRIDVEEWLASLRANGLGQSGPAPPGPCST